VQASPQKTTIDYIDWNCAQDCDEQAVGYQANPATLDSTLLSFRDFVSQNQTVALLEFAVHLSVYGKVYSRPSAIVGYLRDA
jgi:hypothetical protein